YDAYTILIRVHHPPRTTLFPYTTLFRSHDRVTQSPSPFAAPSIVRSLNPVTPRAPHPCARRPSVRPSASHRACPKASAESPAPRSEEHTSELQSRENLVCRLLLEKKKKF